MPKPLTRIAIALLLALALLLPGLAQAESFYRVALSELEAVEGEVPRNLTDGRWEARAPAAVQAYVHLEGEGEAYLLPVQPRDTWRAGGEPLQRDNTDLVVRTPESRDIVGTLYVTRSRFEDAQQGPHRVRFRIAADKADEAARESFYRAMQAHYQRLLDDELPGGAWFRHRLQVAHEALELEGDVPDEQIRRSFMAGEEHDLFAMFSGGRAISENLQLDRLMPAAPGDANRMVDLDEIEGITVEPYEFDLPEDAEVDADPLAPLIPHDQHVVFFPSFGALTQVTDMIERHDTIALNLAEPRSVDMNIGAFYREQLCLPLSELARRLGPHVIQSVALTGSDPYLPTGSDVAVLFETNSPQVLQAFIQARQQQAGEAHNDAKAVQGEHQAIAYHGIVTPDRGVSSYVATVDGKVVVTNSPAQLERIIDTHAGDIETLADQEDYRFFRHRYERSDDAESALVLVPDAAIRRWCGPRWRIATSRRLRAAALLGELQAQHMDALAHGNVDPHPLETDMNIPGGIGEVELDANGVRSSTYGTLEFITPIRELELDEVTEVEANRYRAWRDGYQQEWSQMYDPIAVRLTIAANGLGSDLSVMPLIAGSDFREFIELAEGAAIEPHEGDPHDGTLVHIALAINQEARQFDLFENNASQMVHTLGAQPLSWMGDTVAVYVEDTAFWQELAEIKGPNQRQLHIQQNINRLPIALHVEVRDGLKAAAFLSALRAFVQQSAPDMLEWRTREHHGRSYVEIRPTDAGPAMMGENTRLYYAVSPTSLVITPSETLVQSVLDRKAQQDAPDDDAQAPAEGDADAPQPAEAARQPWLGEHMNLRIDLRTLELVNELFEQPMQQAMQRRAWSNLPILNEWKQRYPNRDPVEVHAEVWGERLVSPQGGGYEWSDDLQSMVASNYGHPVAPEQGPAIPAALSEFTSGAFGITFEDDGLRARAFLHRAEPADEAAEAGAAEKDQRATSGNARGRLRHTAPDPPHRADGGRGRDAATAGAGKRSGTRSR